MCNVGFLLVFLLGINVPDLKDYLAGHQQQWWRVMFLVPVVTSVIRAVAFLAIFKRDTPDYYIMHN